MSYDIFFVRRDPGQSFEDALDDIEESFQGDPGPLTEVERETWDTILALARRILGAVEAFDDETTRELTHPPTGIEVSVFNGEVALRVPDSTSGDRSIDTMGKVYELAKAIERATGLEGYDPQLEEPVTDKRDAGVAPRRDTRRVDDEDDDESPGLDGTSVSPPGPRTTQVLEPDTPPRRWWEFWR